MLGDAYLALGDVGAGAGGGHRGPGLGARAGPRPQRDAQPLALARVLLGSGDEELLDEADAALAEAARLTRDTGARGLEPIVHVELAELARRRGDDAGHERELREAHRRFVAIGAHGRARGGLHCARGERALTRASSRPGLRALAADDLVRHGPQGRADHRAGDVDPEVVPLPRDERRAEAPGGVQRRAGQRPEGDGGQADRGADGDGRRRRRPPACRWPRS